MPSLLILSRFYTERASGPMLPLLLPLQPAGRVAIVPAPLKTTETSEQALDVIPVLGPWVRGSLVGIALGLAGVFGIAAWLNPYNGDGTPLRMGTHSQLGLPPCSFYELTRVPCPSCGMTTSFAFFVQGDLRNSLRANAVGTALAVGCLAFIPWCIASALCKRPLFIISLERALLWTVAIFLSLLLLRWLVVVGMRFLTR